MTRGGLAILLAGAIASCATDSGPRLDTVTPGSASRNTNIVVTGARLCGPNADCATAGGEVQLGLSPPLVLANIVSYSDTSAELAIPAITPLGATELVVTVDERSSNALAFEVLP